MTEASLQDAPCLYFTASDAGFITSVNKNLCTCLGYHQTELVGQKQEIIFTLPTRIFQQTHFYPLLKMQGHAEEIYLSLLTKDKQWLPVLVNAVRKELQGEMQTEIVAIVVNNRKKFEDELVAAKKAAESALNENIVLLQAKENLQKHAELLDQQMVTLQKQNEELHQFNFVVTHDMQEPLRKLFVFTNMLMETGTDEGNIKTVKKIRAVTEQMHAILSGLQQYLWLTETPVLYTKVDVTELVSTLLVEAQKEHPLVRIQGQTSNLLPILADKEQLTVLIKEIISNAIRFRKHETDVSVQFTSSVVQENKFRNLSEKYEYVDFIRLECRDDGEGFESQYKDQVFELFKRLHTKSGRGIGLSLCKKVVQNHKGNIAIDSKPGSGVTLTILLPLHPPSGSVVQKEGKTNKMYGHVEE